MTAGILSIHNWSTQTIYNHTADLSLKNYNEALNA